MNRSNIKLSLLNWLILPILLAIVSINYLLSNIQEPRWPTALADNTVQPTTTPTLLPNIAPYNWAGEGLVTFWFDDAWLSQYEVALPILEKYGYKGAIAVPSHHVGFENYMNWYQLKRAQFIGWEITAHSRTHNCNLENKTSSEIAWEVLGSKE